MLYELLQTQELSPRCVYDYVNNVMTFEVWQGNIDRGEGIVLASDAGTPISSVDDLLSYETEKELFSQLFRLEVLRPGWSERLSKAYHKIFDSKESYEHYCEGIAECQQYERRLIRYMIYVYFCVAAS